MCPIIILLPTDINIFYDVVKDSKANNEPAFWTSIVLYKVNPEPDNKAKIHCIWQQNI